MVELNKNIHWVPEYVGNRRFGNWLEGSQGTGLSAATVTGEAASRSGSATPATRASVSAPGRNYKTSPACGSTIFTNTLSMR